MSLINRLTPLVLNISFLLACTTAPDASVTTSQSSDTDVGFARLPEAISTEVITKLSEEIEEPSLYIGRYSRETWPDSCLGLGKPSELCLTTLTEGWQVEVIDSNTQSYLYRTDFDGNMIRRSTLEHNLPPSLRDRIFQTIAENELVNIEDLSITAAEPRPWDGCYGIASADGNCPEILILGWRAVVSDGNQFWTYHTDNGGTVIRLKD